MSDLQEWFESSSNLLNNQIKRVDVSGCEIGEIDRPAVTAYTQEDVVIESSAGYIRTEDSVDLGDWE